MVEEEIVRSANSVAALRRWLLWSSVFGLLALAGEPAEAQRLRRASVVLEGYVGEAPAGVPVLTRLTLQSGGSSFAFSVTRSAANTGNRSQRQMLNDARPHQNTLVLRGTAAALAPLVSASPGQRLRISGFHRLGTHTVHVNRIDPEAASPTPTVTSP